MFERFLLEVYTLVQSLHIAGRTRSHHFRLGRGVSTTLDLLRASRPVYADSHLRPLSELHRYSDWSHAHRSSYGADFGAGIRPCQR